MFSARHRGIASISIVFLCLPACSAASSPQEGRATEWNVGDGPLSIGGDVAEIQLTKEYVYLEAADLHGLEPLGMFQDATLVVRPADSPVDRVPFWLMAFTWHPLGYVADNDDILDSAAILDVLKSGNEARNEERRRRGLSAIRLTGWFDPPTYDPTHRILRWTEALEGSNPSIVRQARILGRRGFFDVVIHGLREEHATLAAETDRLLESLRFKLGREYTAFDPAIDEVSPYDLTSLITANAFLPPGDPGTIDPPASVGEYVLVDSLRFPSAQAGTNYLYQQNDRLWYDLFVYPGGDGITVESEAADFLAHLDNAKGGDFERYRILADRVWSPVDWADGREVVAELDTEAGTEITYFLVVRARFQFAKIRATLPKDELSIEGARDLSRDLLRAIAGEQPDVVAFARSEGEALDPTAVAYVSFAQSADGSDERGGPPPTSADEPSSIRSTFPDARSLASGTAMKGVLSPANPNADGEDSLGDSYWFEGDAGDVVQLRVSSSDFYPNLGLISADAGNAAAGVMAWYAVRTGLGEDAEVSVVLPSSGEYVAQVWAADDSVGHYTIELDIDSGGEDPSSSFEEVLDDGWIKIGDLQQAGTGLYVHGTSSITTDGTVRIWGSASDGTLQAQNGIEWDMSRYLFEMDCEGKRIREVGIRLYRDGRRVDENPELFESEWRPVEAGIVEETLFGTACR
jgi:hypothetical protein